MKTDNEAQEKYLALVSAMDAVQEGLDELDKVVKRMRPVSVNWRTRTTKELQGLRRNAQATLDDLRDTAKRYEADMIAREWRP
ncbi:hypothetical protein [Actinokineospora globicatena]|uniref:hypothetical protein n=1 Tax=Actinokineospora globicatena TaxID=103729 RepID=UPI0020A5A63C|nr:hypothetical protein [Actinokineospora globicatena]MCP2306096.1 hypothetical protein [Actinokineospora globicatena]GLW80030.1 hypothetical protein Aglo01_45110 [Actinokineospora globicatena]GLW86859.1 hypothetical protein Aglo02_44980 [Actinokineospora globicatena]